MNKKTLIYLTISLLVIIGCNEKSTEPKENNPEWLQAKIETFKSEPVTNPPREILKYGYKTDLTVYYINALCCDAYSTLYSSTGDTLCFPDGGLDGKGDGRCSDFLSYASFKAVIWKDDRKYQ